jgi:S1-C subfamily serine protease
MGIRRGSPAARLRFRKGDYVLAINGKEVKSVRRLTRRMKKRTDQWRITIRRAGKIRNMVINR